MNKTHKQLPSDAVTAYFRLVKYSYMLLNKTRELVFWHY